MYVIVMRYIEHLFVSGTTYLLKREREKGKDGTESLLYKM